MSLILMQVGRNIEFDYKNWRGKISKRKAQIKYYAYGSNEYHEEEQVFLVGEDLEKNEERNFAVKDIFNVKLL